MGIFKNVLWELGEGVADNMEQYARKVSKDKRLSDEDRRNYRDLAEELNQKKQSIHNRDIMGAMGISYNEDDDCEEYTEDDESEANLTNINVNPDYMPFSVSEISDRKLQVQVEHIREKLQ